ncbi:CoA ester lyase, partial [Mesorhizobium sp. M7A.T.Ca.TU.009.01.3.2]
FNEAFSPSAQELEWAHKVVAAANDAATRGLSAFSLNGKMIDPPVVRRAHEILILVGNN